MAYRIELDDRVYAHLEPLRKHDRAKVLDDIERRLEHEPTVETRNRKPMRPNPLASWELRVDDRLRVYFDVYEEPERVVLVRGVGRKKRDRVWLGREEWLP